MKLLSIPLKFLWSDTSTSKQHFVGMLLAGTTRSLLSRQQYEKVRSIMKICNVSLPEWGTLRDVRDRLKKRFGINVSEAKSPLGNLCYGLKVKEVLEQVEYPSDFFKSTIVDWLVADLML